MARFIRLTAAAGHTGRFNVDHIAQYQVHIHSETGCDDAGLEPCRMRSSILLSGMSVELGCRETVEELDRMIDPTGTA